MRPSAKPSRSTEDIVCLVFGASPADAIMRDGLCSAGSFRQPKNDPPIPHSSCSLLRDRFLTLMAHGGDELDWSAIGGLAAKDQRALPGSALTWQPPPV